MSERPTLNLVTELDVLVAEATGLRVFTQPSPCGDDVELSSKGVKAFDLLDAALAPDAVAEPVNGTLASLEYLPDNRLSAEQEVRMRTMELVVKHHASTHVNGLRPQPAWLIAKAKPIEAYILGNLGPNAEG